MPSARTHSIPSVLAVAAMFGLAPVSSARGLTYTEVFQSVGGSATVSQNGDSESDSFWFASSPDPVDQSVSFALAVDNGIPQAQISMEGGLESTFTSTGFSIFAESNFSLASTGIWEGQFVNGEVAGNPKATVRFEVSRPTLVAYSLNASFTGVAGFDQIVGDEVVWFIDFVFEQGRGDPPATGEVLLLPGTYIMYGDASFKGSDAPGYFTAFPENFIDFQLTIIPAAGTTPLLALAALAMTRRRR
ncbi:MAG: hypothetical protein ACTS3F_06150 [Phycisphaerales bacterium]